MTQLHVTPNATYIRLSIIKTMDRSFFLVGKQYILFMTNAFIFQQFTKLNNLLHVLTTF